MKNQLTLFDQELSQGPARYQCGNCVPTISGDTLGRFYEFGNDCIFCGQSFPLTKPQEEKQ